MLLALLYMVLLLVGRGPWALLACAAFTGAWLAVSRTPLGPLWRGNRFLAYLVVLTVVADLFLGPPQGTAPPGPEIHLGPLSVSQAVLGPALATGLRLGLLIL